MSAWSELRDTHALGREGAEQLYVTVRGVARAHHYPPPEGYERWTLDAVAEVAHDFLTGPRAAERLVELASNATDEESFSRLLSRAVLNHLRGIARQTAVGKLIIRLKDLLTGPEYRVEPAGVPGAGNVTLASSAPGVLWNGDPAPLLRAAYAVTDVRLVRWRPDTRREPPLADADSLSRVAGAVLETAAGSMRFADLAIVVGARFGLSAMPAVTGMDTIDLTPDELGAGPESEVLIEDAARSLLGQLSDRDQLVLAWLGEPLSVIADRTGLPRSTAAFAATRLRRHLEVLLSSDEDGEAVLTFARAEVRRVLGLG
jgi:hypothetical protein